jgi:N-glycosylase/DNA lyase
MDLDKYISNYSLENVLKIEYMDKQFLVLKEVWEKIKKMNLIKSEQKKELFLFLILQNALVSYQIAGGGELWWQEFANKIESDFITLSELFVNGKSNTDRWYSFLTSSKYNKRIYNIKIARLRKFDVFLGLKNNTMFDYYHNMESLLTDVCMVM